MYLFFRAKAPIYLICDPNPLRQNFFCPCQPGGILLKELNMNTIELLLHPASFFINKAI